MDYNRKAFQTCKDGYLRRHYSAGADLFSKSEVIKLEADEQVMMLKKKPDEKWLRCDLRQCPYIVMVVNNGHWPLV